MPSLRPTHKGTSPLDPIMLNPNPYHFSLSVTATTSPCTIRVVIALSGSFVQTSTPLIVLPRGSSALYVTVMKPLSPGPISAELAEALVQRLQPGTTLLTMSFPVPVLTNSNLWLTAFFCSVEPKSWRVSLNSIFGESALCAGDSVFGAIWGAA